MPRRSPNEPLDPATRRRLIAAHSSTATVPEIAERFRLTKDRVRAEWEAAGLPTRAALRSDNFRRYGKR